MTDLLYSKLAGVGHLFYKFYFPHEKIAFIIDGYLKKFNCKKIVFFGALIYAAKILQSRGYEITFVDYTKEMVDEAKKVLQNTKFVVSDMRTLELEEKQDAIVLMGRILTYMYTDEDVLKAFSAFKNNLKDSGIIVVDNYEISKIDKGGYFNGIIEVKDKNLTIRRISKISRQKNQPAVYKWDCIYEKAAKGEKEIFEDKNHILRAFSKDEMEELVKKSKLKFIGNFPNFEERSFITVAQK
jgi:ubiquinone/menaquinone biosynthesis C-methylase UbiE